MTTHEIAHAFTRLCAEGKLQEAQQFWSDDVVSVEAFPGEHQIARGREAVLQKQRIWSEGTTMHGMTCQGPFINGDQFSTVFELDCTGWDGKRQVMREVALYSVRDGAIAEERFFPLMG
ncbi:MAG: nuclear transport factor 2 family protein [Luteimonas sp.]|nr:nuclear transport factor 2 family protein [Luteimonas sp.]